MQKKIGILIENHFFEPEIIYYPHRFAEDGIQTEFLTRLWGQPFLTFKGNEFRMEMSVDKSFEGISDEELKEYAAIIIPGGYVADMLRYAEKPGDIAPAVQFTQRAMKEKSIIKGVICHGLWMFDPIPGDISGRRVTCHNNLIGSVKNTGAIYTDEDIVIDSDLITARHSGLFARFTKTIIDKINEKGV